MKLIDNLDYRQWQKRNSLAFNQLDKLKQKDIRKKGYSNKGWSQVQKSWIILQKYNHKIINIFDHKLAKGDLLGAIDLAIMDSEQTNKIASEAIATIEKKEQRLDELANNALNKYQPL